MLGACRCCCVCLPLPLHACRRRRCSLRLLLLLRLLLPLLACCRCCWAAAAHCLPASHASLPAATLRLVGGAAPTVGRLEVLNDGVWGESSRSCLQASKL